MRYLRLTSCFDRSRDQIEAELDFVSYLGRGGVNAMPPMSSEAGRVIEEISDGDDFHFACVFEKAEGEEFHYDTAKSRNEHFKLRGRALGQIHRLSKSYVPAGSSRRFSWEADSLLLEITEFLPKFEKLAWREYDELTEWLQDYPKSGDTYGLIHGDFGATNLRQEGGKLNIFDFDDCCYHWFLYDLAVTIYPHGWRKEGMQLLDCLLEGYSEEMKLKVTLADLTLFCRWRLLYIFLVYARRWGFENLSTQQAEWFGRKRENIDTGYRWRT
jgi:Ser/Thr protein kinase RdoA (MazF antagonist)